MENLLKCTIRGWFDDDIPGGRDVKSGQITGTEEEQHRRSVVPQDDKRFHIGSDDNAVTWIYADHGCDRQYLHSPVYHVNPKGWVDAYRVPKYMYYRWQANFTEPLMVFIHPHDWTARLLGTERTIRVDSNADEVELWRGDRCIGKAAPSEGNHRCVAFPGVTVTEETLRAVARRGGHTEEHLLPMAGTASRLTLCASHACVPADRTGIVLLTAGVEDEAGHRVYGANPVLRWAVSGPGRLLAPETWHSDRESYHAREGTMYIDLPVHVPLRSTTEEGTIEVRLAAEGLRPASARIRAVRPEANVIDGLELLPEPDRTRVAPPVRPCLPADEGVGLGLVYEDVELPEAPGTSMEDRVREQLRRWFGAKACQRPALGPLVQELTRLFEEGEGRAIADDINTAIGIYNRGRIERVPS